MEQLIPEHLIGQIFKLNLPARLVADKKVAFPILIKNQIGENTYKIILDLGENNISIYTEILLELRGNIDIEYLKYRGEVELTPIPDEPNYYKMKILNFYKSNQRRYKRVPYRRSIEIVSPVICDAILINLSASGALIHSKEKIEGDSLTIEFELLKKEMELVADIIEQKYNEKLDVYEIRCNFSTIDRKSQKIILKAVKAITLRAKKRLQKQE